ncbi:MAG: hypothetical protein ACOYIF_07265 [Acetivibrionales bacterium]
MIKGNEAPDFYPIKDPQALGELNGYVIDGICESLGDGKKRLIIILKRELPNGKSVQRELMIIGTTNKFVTGEY